MSLAVIAAACGGDESPPRTAGSAVAISPIPTSPSAPPSASPSEPSLPPIPDGDYQTTVKDPDRTFFGTAPAITVLTIDEGAYELVENGIRFEAGVYSGSGNHVEFKALVGSCAGRESVHAYNWSLEHGKLTFSTKAGHVCIGRMILFTEYVFTRR